MMDYTKFRAIGFFNETDTLESSSILIYSESETVRWCEGACNLGARHLGARHLGTL